MKDYNFELSYHPDKANIVVDALNWHNYVANLCVAQKWRLIDKVIDAVIILPRGSERAIVASLSVMSKLYH